MADTTENIAIRAWKQQFDNAARVFQALAEGAIRIRELQLKAANDARQRVDKARRSIDEADDTADLWRIQTDWFARTLERSVDYWTDLNHATMNLQTSVTRVVFEPGSPLSQQAAVLPEASKTAFVLMDDAYRRWRDATTQLWGAAEGRANNVFEFARKEFDEAVDETRDIAKDAIEGQRRRAEEIGDEAFRGGDERDERNRERASGEAQKFAEGWQDASQRASEAADEAQDEVEGAAEDAVDENDEALAEDSPRRGGKNRRNRR